jgi:HD-GYP domain-containing protein (c-di-GMP phosphodiesterase class II)
MTSDRPYRSALPLKAAIAEVVAESGRQFDPACVKTFADLPPEDVQAMLEAHEPLPL